MNFNRPRLIKPYTSFKVRNYPISIVYFAHTNANIKIMCVSQNILFPILSLVVFVVFPIAIQNMYYNIEVLIASEVYYFYQRYLKVPPN